MGGLFTQLTSPVVLQQDSPDDYVVATGKQVSVREFVEMAFREIGVQLEWRGAGVEEEGLDVKTGAVRVGIDPRYFRPTEVEALLGDPSKAEEKLGWTACTSLSVMVKEMVADDLNGAEKDEMLRREGFQTFDYYE